MTDSQLGEVLDEALGMYKDYLSHDLHYRDPDESWDAEYCVSDQVDAAYKRCAPEWELKQLHRQSPGFIDYMLEVLTGDLVAFGVRGSKEKKAKSKALEARLLAIVGERQYEDGIDVYLRQEIDKRYDFDEIVEEVQQDLRDDYEMEATIQYLSRIETPRY